MRQVRPTILPCRLRIAEIRCSVRSIPALYDLDARKKIIDTHKDYAQILSYPTTPVEAFARDFSKAVEQTLARGGGLSVAITLTRNSD